MNPSPELFEAIAAALWRSLWWGSLIAFLLGLALVTVLRNAPARVRYQVALGALLLAFLGTLPVLIPETNPSQPLSLGSAKASAAAPEASGADLRFQANPETDFRLRAFGSQMLVPACACLWIAGAFVSLLRFLVGWLRLGHACGNATPITDPRILRSLAVVRAQLGVRERLRIRAANGIGSPMMAGFLWPTILVPTSLLAGIPANHLQAILAHEIAHHRRWDYVVNLFQCLIEALFFYHPAIRWISKVIREEREAACDQLAISHSVSLQDFAHALAWAEEQRSRDGFSVLVPAMTSDHVGTLRRIERLLGRSANPRPLCAGDISFPRLLAIGCLAFTLPMGPLSAQNPVLSSPSEDSSGRPAWIWEIQERLGSLDAILALFNQGGIQWPEDRPPLFVSPLTIERGGVLYRLDHETPRLFSALPNAYLAGYDLNFLDRKLPDRDPDGDGFTVREEFDAGTRPDSAECHPPYLDKLAYLEPLVRLYRIRFDALPDGKTAQLTRLPSAAWTEAKAYLREGQISADGQIRVESISPQEVIIHHLPTGAEVRLEKRKPVEIPIRFARLEWRLPGGDVLVVREGDSFPDFRSKEPTYRLEAVDESTATITSIGNPRGDGEPSARELPLSSPIAP